MAYNNEISLFIHRRFVYAILIHYVNNIKTFMILYLLLDNIIEINI